MAKFRTKPVEVDALLYTYPASEEIKAFCGNLITGFGFPDNDDEPGTIQVYSDDNQCDLVVHHGDWVVKDSVGNLNVFTHEEFLDSYDNI